MRGCAFEGLALVVQGGHRVEALVRVAVWPARSGELSWAGHFLHPNPPRVLELGQARLQLPETTEAEITIEARACGSDHDLGGDFAGLGLPPVSLPTSG
jgi:hypothetical protein